MAARVVSLLLIPIIYGQSLIDSRNEHLCIMDTQHYHEASIITNLCIDLIEEYNMSFRIDCDANSVTYSEYKDKECKIKETYGLPDDTDLFRIEEGCDDPFDLNAYVQIKECDDADYIGGGSGGKAASVNYTDCEWFGFNETNVPILPVGICTAHSHEDELDSLVLYSTKYECNYNENGEMTQAEWNNTECRGAPYNTITYRKEDGYFFNCGDGINVLPTCPFTKIKLVELRNISGTDNGGGSSGGGSGGSGSTSSNKKNNDMAIIFTVIIGIVIIILVIMIGFTIIARKNRANQVMAANIDQQPLTVDFKSIEHAVEDDRSINNAGRSRMHPVVFSEEPDSIQQITTQGQDIQEISVASSEAGMR